MPRPCTERAGSARSSSNHSAVTHPTWPLLLASLFAACHADCSQTQAQDGKHGQVVPRPGSVIRPAGRCVCCEMLVHILATVRETPAIQTQANIHQTNCSMWTCIGAGKSAAQWVCTDSSAGICRAKRLLVTLSWLKWCCVHLFCCLFVMQ